MFNPEKYLISMGRNKDGTPRMYLQTAHRILWFRTENPLGRITTDLVQVDPYPVMRATVSTADGMILATAYGSAQPKAGSVYAGREIEKAETAAVGRALGMAGYGTQFDGDSDDDNLAGSPMERPSTPEPAPLPAHLIAWTKEQRKAWVAYLEDNGWHIDQIKAALDVSLILDYTGTQNDANAAIDAYAAANDTDDDGAPTPLSEAEAIRLTAYAKKAHKMNYGDLCKALGVSDLRGYTGSYDDTIDALKVTVQA